MRRMYSEKQIKDLANSQAEEVFDEKIAETLDDDVSITGDLAVGGDLTAKTLKQSEASETYTMSVDTHDESLTIEEHSFLACKVVNGILWAIIEAHVVNGSESAITKDIDFIVSNLSEATASKIYRSDGNPVSNAPVGSNTGVAQQPALVKFANSRVAILSYNAKQLTFKVPSTSWPVGDGGISVRIPIIIVWSETQSLIGFAGNNLLSH